MMSKLEEQLERIKKYEIELRRLFPEYKDLLRVTACFREQLTDQEELIHEWKQELDTNDTLKAFANLPKHFKSKKQYLNTEAFKEIILGMDCMTLETYAVITQALSSVKATEAANAKHSRPGGSHEKQAKIRELWASGKYSSRDVCAEQECASLNMSFSAARKALRNTPSPTSHCPA